MLRAILLCAGALAASAAQAQQIDLSASPFLQKTADAAELAELKLPKLDFEATPEDANNYDKYYYFHRPQTDFQAAYADVNECDGYARGLSSGFKGASVPYPYAGTMAGAVGGAIGNAMIAAIFVPAEKRRMRRVNMRQCMGFKGYQRYGLSKDRWLAFNFEEGTGEEKEDLRTRALLLQALVASTAKPAGEVQPR